MNEAQMQCEIVRKLRSADTPILFTTTGAGLTDSVRHGVKMKRMGYTVGTPDLLIFEPGYDGTHGLLLELKTPTGQVSIAQELMHNALKSRGYAVVVVRSVAQAIAHIERHTNRKISITEHAAPPIVCPAQPSSEKPHS